jgi:hypothetical protein
MEVVISTHHPNGGRKELEKVQAAVSTLLETLGAEGFEFDTTFIDEKPYNLHLSEEREKVTKSAAERQALVDEELQSTRPATSNKPTEVSSNVGVPKTPTSTTPPKG